ncbi:MAG: hypothetical protein RQ753_10495, partial [Desulfurivibrionaceae bacterium]|nr:hypothetical protein [Desulfurivibrionaceae bacterium]
MGPQVTGWLSKKSDMQGVAYFNDRGHTYGMPKEKKCAPQEVPLGCATMQEIGVFATPLYLTNSQKGTGWLSKNFDMQGV